MTRDQIGERIANALATVLGHRQFELNDSLVASDVEGWDSLTHMSIITAVEKEFSVRFKLKEINKLKDMGSLIDLVEGKMNAPA